MDDHHHYIVRNIILIAFRSPLISTIARQRIPKHRRRRKRRLATGAAGAGALLALALLALVLVVLVALALVALALVVMVVMLAALAGVWGQPLRRLGGALPISLACEGLRVTAGGAAIRARTANPPLTYRRVSMRLPWPAHRVRCGRPDPVRKDERVPGLKSAVELATYRAILERQRPRHARLIKDSGELKTFHHRDALDVPSLLLQAGAAGLFDC
jgi:hypothetical protein